MITFKAFFMALGRTLKALGVVCGAFLMSLTAAEAANSQDADGSKVLVIGTDAAYAPFSWRSEGGELKGIDVDLWQAIARDQKIEYKLQARDFDYILKGLSDGTIDAVIAACNYSEERGMLYDFSDPYFVSDTVAIASSFGHIESLDHLTGLTVAVKDLTVSEQWARENQEKLQLRIRNFTTTVESFMAVHMGSCDFTIVDAPIADYTLQTGLYPGLEIVLRELIDNSKFDSFYMLVKKGHNQELLEKFNAGLKNIRASGEYQKIIDKYLSH